MAQTNLTIRIDESLKKEAETLFGKVGLTMTSAIVVYFRQAILEQAIPFTIKAKTAEEKYNEYFTPEVVESILQSRAQFERGESMTFTLDELSAMETGEMPQRAIAFLEKHKKEK